jgi:hypothetical protein
MRGGNSTTLGGVAWTVFAVLSAFALGSSAREAEEPATGLDGWILVGPSRPGPTRDVVSDRGRPLVGLFHVERGEETVTEFETDDEGHFRIALEPGAYEIVPDPTVLEILPRRQRREATVPAEGFGEVTLRFDSGLR